METKFDNSELVEIRGFYPEDKNFVKATWLKGLRYGNDWFKLIDSDAYYSTYSPLIDALLNHKDVKVEIACLKEARDVILGYSVYQGNKLHWVLVKDRWRGIGIARRMVPKTIDTVTHLTKIGVSIFKNHKGFKFNPF